MVQLTKIMRKYADAIPGAIWLWRTLHCVCHPHERAVRRTQKRSPGLMLQPSHYTSVDRYPWLFDFLRAQLREQQPLRVLSYGCATGEEMFSLEAYLPHAELVGIDINPRNIKICNRSLSKRTVRSHIEFRCAGSPAAETAESYDAILCLAVLRHGALQESMPDSCAAYIDFATVDRLATELARCLKPGGYLAIWHSHFRFADLSVASQFTTALSHDRQGRTNGPFYGSDNHRLDCLNYSKAVFKKRP